MQGGKVFLETHHIVPLGEKGKDVIENVAAICPNHHREAHHGAARKTIQRELLKRVRQQRMTNGGRRPRRS